MVCRYLGMGYLPDSVTESARMQPFSVEGRVFDSSRVKPMTYKMYTSMTLGITGIGHGLVVTVNPVSRYCDWVGIWVYDAHGLVFQRCSTIKSQWVCTVNSWNPSWYDLRCCKDVNSNKHRFVRNQGARVRINCEVTSFVYTPINHLL